MGAVTDLDGPLLCDLAFLLAPRLSLPTKLAEREQCGLCSAQLCPGLEALGVCQLWHAEQVVMACDDGAVGEDSGAPLVASAMDVGQLLGLLALLAWALAAGRGA
jgi:hypothetical protein